MQKVMLRLIIFFFIVDKIPLIFIDIEYSLSDHENVNYFLLIIWGSTSRSLPDGPYFISEGLLSRFYLYD